MILSIPVSISASAVPMTLRIPPGRIGQGLFLALVCFETLFNSREKQNLWFSPRKEALNVSPSGLQGVSWHCLPS